MATHVPAGTTDVAVEEIRTREAAHSAELADAGALRRLWRPPLTPGQWRTLGLFAAADAHALGEVLSSMPLRTWRTDAVTPLMVHPDDPPNSIHGSAIEFLITMSITVPRGTAQNVTAETMARESERARQLAAQGHLIRLWSMSCEGCPPRTLGLWSADDLAQISATVRALPLSPWMKAVITPLSAHPNDPAPRSTAAKGES